MIVVKIIGGIGNQMFQYAVGLCLAEKNNTELKLAISDFAKYGNRKFQLNVFNINAEIATQDEIDKIKSENYRKEKHFHFDSKVLDLPDNVYLDGYWQSEKYFKDIETIIRKEFTFKETPDDTNQELLDKIKSSNSVCIHIRRGDYVSTLKARLVHGTCSLNYYKKAMSFIIRKIENPHFYIFSDDTDWVKKNFKINDKMTIVDNNNDSSGCLDLMLMSNCQHFIIANSSFSWWASWLGKNPRKLIFAPKRWFGILSNVSSKDLYVKEWITT
ncbi:MAG: alpha-1,2-fucosyltransferase [bacterium]